jgi:proton-coupled amino acid transporter
MSKPVNISSPKSGPVSIAGTPLRSVVESVRAQYLGNTPPRNIPPRAGTPRLTDRSTSGVAISDNVSARSLQVGGISAGRPGTPATPESAGQTVAIEDLPDEAKAKVLRKHLVSQGEREGTPGSADGPSFTSLAREGSEVFPVPYNAPGADVVFVTFLCPNSLIIELILRHDIYKWQQEQRREGRRRSVSFAGSTSIAQDPAFEHIHEPGGFRRNYVLLQNGNGHRDDPRMLNNFVDFLYIFGHFVSACLVSVNVVANACLEGWRRSRRD